jgi:hypothetical protein
MIHPYIQARWPVKWRICGTDLLPFSIGHMLLLRRVGSPFVPDASEAETIEPGHLAMAVLICTRNFEQGCRFIDSRWVSLRARIWARWRRSVLVGDRLDLRVDMFQRYINQAWSMPQRFSDSPDELGSSGSHIPIELEIATVLQWHCHLPENQIMDLPLGDALWRYNLALQQRGMIRLMTRDDDDLFARADAMAAEEQAKTPSASPFGVPPSGGPPTPAPFGVPPLGGPPASQPAPEAPEPPSFTNLPD